MNRPRDRASAHGGAAVLNAADVARMLGISPRAVYDIPERRLPRYLEPTAPKLGKKSPTPDSLTW